MIPIQLIREKADWVKERLTIKNFKEIELVDEIAMMDEQRRKAMFAMEENKAKQNEASKTIGELMRKGEKTAAEKIKNEINNNRNN